MDFKEFKPEEIYNYYRSLISNLISTYQKHTHMRTHKTGEI